MDKCSARRHLRGADFALYDAAMQLTAECKTNGEKRILFASLETLARMTGYAPRTAGLARIRLEENGWLRASQDWKRAQQRTGAAGKFSTPHFEVIEHSDWCESHPGTCPDTGYLSSAYGESADGATGRGEQAGTGYGRTTFTGYGQQVSKALKDIPNREKPKSLCSLRCASGWEFIGMPKAGSGKFQAIFDEAFVDYKNESDVCAEKHECSCERVAFVESVLDACKGRKVRYPSSLLDPGEEAG